MGACKIITLLICYESGQCESQLNSACEDLARCPRSEVVSSERQAHKEGAAWQCLVNDCRASECGREREVRVRWPYVPLRTWIFNGRPAASQRRRQTTTATYRCRYRLVVVADGGRSVPVERQSTAPPADVTNWASGWISPRSVPSSLVPSLRPRLLVCSPWWMTATFVKSGWVSGARRGARFNGVRRDNATTHRGPAAIAFPRSRSV